MDCLAGAEWRMPHSPNWGHVVCGWELRLWPHGDPFWPSNQGRHPPCYATEPKHSCLLTPKINIFRIGVLPIILRAAQSKAAWPLWAQQEPKGYRSNQQQRGICWRLPRRRGYLFPFPGESPADLAMELLGSLPAILMVVISAALC